MLLWCCLWWLDDHNGWVCSVCPHVISFCTQPSRALEIPGDLPASFSSRFTTREERPEFLHVTSPI
jgi:hypothetical protein